MNLDPTIAGLLDLMTAHGAPSLATGSPERAREMFRTITVGTRTPGSLPEVASVSDETVPGPDGGIPVRVYRPATDGPVPTLVFFHGGGWVIGDLDTHDDHARLLCREVGAVVVSVAYRLAPEHAFPAGLTDCLAATRWAAAGIDRLGGDAERLAVGGDSAGGNLAAAVTLACRQAGPRLAGQLLLYPAVDLRDVPERYPSREQNANGYFLTADDMRWFRESYLPNEADRSDPRASPLLAEDHSGLPPAVLAVAGFDPLRDEGLAYAEALAADGVPVVTRNYGALVHGFFGMGGFAPAAASAVGEIVADFRQLMVEKAP